MKGPVNDEAGGLAEDGGHGEWLTEVLDSEYGRYEPDSQRIRTLLDERMEGTRGGRALSPAARLRLTGIPAGIAVAALCAAVAVAVTATVTDNHPDSTPNAATSRGGLPVAGTGPGAGASRSPAGSPGPGTRGSVSGQGAGAATKGTGATGSGVPSASPPASSSASNTGGVLTGVTGSLAPTSNPSWTEEDVRMTLTAPVTALRLTIKVAPNVQLAPSSDWSNYDITAFDLVLNSGSSGLIYTFNLKPGNTIPTGPLTIAVQFTHSRQRDPSGDTYALSVTTDQAHGSVSSGAQGSF